jgi:hypothetical protein
MALFGTKRHDTAYVEDAPVHDPALESLSEHHAEHHTEQIEEVEPVTRRIASPGAYEVRPAIGSLSARIGLSLLGGGLMILSAFLAWYSNAFSVNGTQVSYRVFDPMSDSSELAAGFFTSAGLVAIVLGGLALLGMAFRSGWLTRVAGVLGVIAFVLYGIRLYRGVGQAFVADFGLGAWLLLAGGVVSVLGGFMGTARQVVVPEETTIVTHGHSTTWAA